MLLALLSILLLFFVGFACGYGVRELMRTIPNCDALEVCEASATQRRPGGRAQRNVNLASEQCVQTLRANPRARCEPP